MSDLWLICVLIVSILLIVVLITKFKLHAFLSLTFAGFFVAIMTNMKLELIGATLEKGVGGTLGFLAIIIGCGTILGKMLEISGGAVVISRTLVNALGEKRASTAMMLVGFIAGIPVFVEVGFVLLVPLVFVVAKQIGISRIKIGIPLATSLMTVHCIVPPHPAATAIAGMLKAEIGTVILLGLFVGLICAFIGGVLYMSFIKNDLECANNQNEQNLSISSNLPSAKLTFFTILLPLALMLLKTIFLPFSEKNSFIYELILFLSNPITALVICVFVSYYTLGLSRGLNMQKIQDVTSSCFMPIGSILLIIGAGGAFNEILVASGIGEALKNVLSSLSLSPILLAWLVAIILHMAVGSATVAMISATGIVLPLVEGSGISKEVIAIAIGSGAIGLTIVTDSLFWLVKESLGMSVKQMLKYFSVATTLASVSGLMLSFILANFI